MLYSSQLAHRTSPVFKPAYYVNHPQSSFVFYKGTLEGSGSLFFKALSFPFSTTGNWTPSSALKGPYVNHYTIVEMHGVGFEPTRFTTPGLKSGSLDHSDNRALLDITLRRSMSVFQIKEKLLSILCNCIFDWKCLDFWVSNPGHYMTPLHINIVCPF